MGLILITPAATLPVSLAAVKAHCGVEDASHDVALDAIRRAACAHVAATLGRALGEATWQLNLDAFADAIELRQGPVLEVASVAYTDTAGAPQVVPPATYTLDLTSTPQWIVRNVDADWPEVLAGPNVVRITFTAGWTEETLPPDLNLAVLMLAAAWFDNRTADVPKGVDALLWPHRTIRI